MGRIAWLGFSIEYAFIFLSFLPLSLYRDSTYHEHHLIGLACHILVHPTLQVGGLPLHSILAHTTQTYLVGHEDIGGIVGCKAVELGFEGFESGIHVLQRKEIVGTPEGDAVDDSHTSVRS